MRNLIVTMFAVMTAILFQQGHAVAQAAAAPPPVKNSSPKTAPAPAASGIPTDKDIADAKAKGLVWTNPTTKVYHKDGEFYGKTKNGKFMSESDAKRQYYRPSPDAMKKADPPKAAAPASGQLKKQAATKSSKTDGKTKPALP